MSIEAISPIDGRYRNKTKILSKFFSEKALMSYRIKAEIEYFIALSRVSETKIRQLTAEEIQSLRNLHHLSDEDAQIIKDIETNGYTNIQATNHDVKAIEYYIKLKLRLTTIRDSIEWIHFAITSEDINNIAYALMTKDALEQIIVPKIEEMYNLFDSAAIKYKDVPMLARTHGQAATPTTFGKETRVYAQRVKAHLKQLKEIKIKAKLNGATGNFNAHVVAFPNVDWKAFSFNLISELDIKPNLFSTQIEPHDTFAQLFDVIKRLNIVLIDFNQDSWRYISDGWIVQKPVQGEVGSSTMPHKVNPIDFENSEGNLAIANALFEHLSRKLPISRLQRDLSDSTTLRNIGVAFAHSYIAYLSLLKGLTRIELDIDKLTQTLDQHPEVIAEAIQTILRREGETLPYEKLKELTRGKKVTLADFHNFISSLNISAQVKEELKKITPSTYLGLAPSIAQNEYPQ